MADLRYEDVQRAIQAALQNIVQTQMNDIRNTVYSINNQVSRIDDQEYKIDDINRQLGVFNQQISQLNNTLQNLANQLNTMQTLPGAITDVRYRIEALERFANDMSNYLHKRQSREDQERGFQGADSDDL